jgi:putative endonuclease
MTPSVVIKAPTVQTTDIGQRAERAVAEYLQERGFEIVNQNWKVHKVCEIDIVARLQNTMYFVEVKYRRSSTAGAGLDYITAVKLKQMRFAAVQWATMHAWRGSYELAAAEVSGPDFDITNFVDSIFD